MTIQERFDTAVAAATATSTAPELPPERIATACLRVLPVDGAGVSLFLSVDRRLALGASDGQAAEAERLQFVVGEGPCLESHAAGRPIVADKVTIRSHWPSFYEELVARTQIRGIISLPLTDDHLGFGALNLYLAPPHDVGAVTLSDALAVAAEVSSVFVAADGLASAVRANRSGFEPLRKLAEVDDRLDADQLDGLIAQAADQPEWVTRERRRMTADVFGRRADATVQTD